MAIIFFTPLQGMRIYSTSDLNNPLIPWEISCPFTNDNNYSLQFEVSNDDLDAPPFDATVKLVHSAFGIGLPGDNLNLITDLFPVTVPHGGGSIGCNFTFVSNDGIHCCFTAQFADDTPQHNIIEVGNIRNQVMAVTDFKVVNDADSNLSFIITNNQDNPSPTLNLSIEEHVNDINGALIHPSNSDSWKPALVAPLGSGLNIIPPTITDESTETYYEIKDIGLGKFYSIKLKISPQLSTNLTPRLFHIKGAIPPKINVGSLELKVELLGSSIAYNAPDPYVNGGFQSEDVILYYPNTMDDIVIDGDITYLVPGTNYGFAARVHNNTNTDAVNTVVKFWHFPSLGAAGTFIDVQTVTVPANGFVVVLSGYDFPSDPNGDHRCAVVSIYNSQVNTGNPDNIDAIESSEVPTPYNPHSYSAWRNTGSMTLKSLHFQFKLATSHIELEHGPVDIEIQTYHINDEWYKKHEVVKADNLLKSSGKKRTVPLYMMPALRQTMEHIEIKTGIRTKHEFKITEGLFKNRFFIHPIEKQSHFEVFGDVPSHTKNGDVILVNVIAHYPQTKKTPAKSIEFLEVLHIKR